MTHLKELREIIYSEEFVEMMQNLTGTRLRRKFDMSGHRYGDKVSWELNINKKKKMITKSFI